MKKLIFILFFVPFNFSAQDVQNRILLIKEMYKETNRLMDKENVICKKIKAIEYDDDEIEIERRIIKYCDFDNGYSKITIEIIGITNTEIGKIKINRIIYNKYFITLTLNKNNLTSLNKKFYIKVR